MSYPKAPRPLLTTPAFSPLPLLRTLLFPTLWYELLQEAVYMYVA